MRVTDIPQINNLGAAEKILLVEDLWDSISSEESAIPVPLSHVKELNKRFNKYSAGQGTLLSLDELRAKIETRK